MERSYLVSRTRISSTRCDISRQAGRREFLAPCVLYMWPHDALGRLGRGVKTAERSNFGHLTAGLTAGV